MGWDLTRIWHNFCPFVTLHFTESKGANVPLHSQIQPDQFYNWSTFDAPFCILEAETNFVTYSSCTVGLGDEDPHHVRILLTQAIVHRYRANGGRLSRRNTARVGRSVWVQGWLHPPYRCSLWLGTDI